VYPLLRAGAARRWGATARVGPLAGSARRLKRPPFPPRLPLWGGFVPGPASSEPATIGGWRGDSPARAHERNGPMVVPGSPALLLRLPWPSWGNAWGWAGRSLGMNPRLHHLLIATLPEAGGGIPGISGPEMALAAAVSPWRGFGVGVDLVAREMGWPRAPDALAWAENRPGRGRTPTETSWASPPWARGPGKLTGQRPVAWLAWPLRAEQRGRACLHVSCVAGPGFTATSGLVSNLWGLLRPPGAHPPAPSSTSCFKPF